MKISKILTGLVVCGALIFPGALSSSAQEINPSVSLDSAQESNSSISLISNNYLAEHELKLSTLSAIPNTISVFKGYTSYQGKSIYHMTYGAGSASATIYHGYLQYQYQDGPNMYYYQGTLTKY